MKYKNYAYVLMRLLSIVFILIAIEEFIGWEVKKAQYGAGVPAGLIAVFMKNDMPYTNFIEWITIFICIIIALILWRFSNKYKSDDKLSIIIKNISIQKLIVISCTILFFFGLFWLFFLKTQNPTISIKKATIKLEKIFKDKKRNITLTDLRADKRYDIRDGSSADVQCTVVTNSYEASALYKFANRCDKENLRFVGYKYYFNGVFKDKDIKMIGEIIQNRLNVKLDEKYWHEIEKRGLYYSRDTFGNSILIKSNNMGPDGILVVIEDPSLNLESLAQ
jgi:hypothetical protein